MAQGVDPDPQALNAAILAAHAARDGAALARLYEEAAMLKRAGDEPEAAGFLTVQAYIYALECGDERAGRLRERLRAEGREA